MPSVLKRTQSPRAARAAARNKVVSPVSVSINDGTISLMMRGAVVLPAGTFDVLFDGESGGQLVIPDPAHAPGLARPDR
jgi:hypothetical protein